MVVSLIVLLILFLFIILFLLNKEYILSKFNNKLIKLYIKYQILLSKISFILLPILIIFGLIGILIILHYIITHPIPFDCLNIDLYTYVSTKK